MKKFKMKVYDGIYWGFVSSSLLFGLAYKNPLVLSLSLIMLMGRFIARFGNFVNVDYNIKLREFLKPILLFISLTLVTLILPKQSLEEYFKVLISSATLFSIFFILLKEVILTTVGITFNNFNKLIKFIRKYLFRISKGTILGLLAELPLIISFFIYLPNGINLGSIIILWSFSAIFFVLLRGTNFIFDEDKKSVLLVIKLFGLTRFGFFLLPFIEINTFISFYISLFFFFIYMISMLYVFYPYIFESKNISLAIDILKLLDSKKKLKLNQIAKELDETPEVIEKIINSLKKRYYIQEFGNFYEVKTFKRIME